VQDRNKFAMITLAAAAYMLSNPLCFSLTDMVRLQLKCWKV